MSDTTIRDIDRARPTSGTGRRWLSARGAACVYLGLLVLVAATAGWIAPYDPADQDLAGKLGGISSTHWLGTDHLGRDELSRLIGGSRIPLLAALQAVGIALLLGVPSGVIAGYFRGVADAVLNRIADALMSIPSLVLALGIIAALGPSLTNAMLAIGIVFAPRIFRLARGVARDLSARVFVEALRSVGCSNSRILWRHLLPRMRVPLGVQTALITAESVLAEATLSFLGFGVAPPTPSWGLMLEEAQGVMSTAPHLVIVPGLAIVVTVLAFSVLGDAPRTSTRASRG